MAEDVLPLRTILVDDEALSLSSLGGILKEVPEIDIIGTCQNGRQAVEMATSEVPDLLFLDIQMPGLNGFQVVQKLQSDLMPMIVFSTAYDKYAAEAFDLHAVDYVLKPFDADRVKRAVDRVIERAGSSSAENRKKPLIGAIKDISENINEESFPSSATRFVDGMAEDSQRKIAIRDGSSVTFLPFEDIEWVDAAGDYMCVHASGETYVARSTLKDLLDKLDEKLFKRIHRSTIVNISSIVKISSLPKGERLLRLSSGHNLKVSRTYRNSINQLIK